MAAYTTTAQLLSFVQLMSGLPAVNDEMEAADWYILFTLAQEEIWRMFTAHVPWALYGDPVLLTTSDGGYTYDFPSQPWGGAEIRESRTGRQLFPGQESDHNIDFTIEGTKIRWTNNRVRTFGSGPYARYASEPSVIDAETDPSLMPTAARIYIAWRALEMWAARGSRKDPTFFAREVQKGLWGDPKTPGMVGLIPALKKAYLYFGGTDGGMGFKNYWDLINTETQWVVG